MQALNCPFYGRSLHHPKSGPPFLAVKSDDNRCGLIVAGREACYMETEGMPVDWRECPYARQILVEWTEERQLWES